MPGLTGFMAEQLLRLSGGNPVVAAVYAGLFVTATTSLGSLVALAAHKLPKWSVELSLSYAAGVMIVASFTSLILPAIEASGGFSVVAVGIALGLFLVYLVDRFVPHEHLVKGFEGPPELGRLLKKAWLVALAVIIHNLPEGLAVGTTMVYDVGLGVVTAIAIGIQDIPEGTVVSLPLAVLQGRRLQPVAIGVLSGVSELLTAVAGALLFSMARPLLPLGLALAGGAMLYVTVKEMIPEIYRKEENELLVTAGFFLGFYTMLFLDTML